MIPQSEEEDEYNLYQLKIGDTPLIFEEGTFDVTLTIKGALDQNILKTILNETAKQLEAVEGKPYIFKKIQ